MPSVFNTVRTATFILLFLEDWCYWVIQLSSDWKIQWNFFFLDCINSENKAKIDFAGGQLPTSFNILGWNINHSSSVAGKEDYVEYIPSKLLLSRAHLRESSTPRLVSEHIVSGEMHCLFLVSFLRDNAVVMGRWKWEPFADTVCRLRSMVDIWCLWSFNLLSPHHHCPRGLCHEKTDDDRIALFIRKVALQDKMPNPTNYKWLE